MHFFISHLASWLRTRRFSEPTFRPSGATNHWKNAHLYLLSSYSFSSTLLSSNLSLLSASSLLCFSSLHIVGSLTSKLPSIKHHVSCIYMYLKLTYVYLCVNCVCVFHVAFTSVTSFRSLLPVVQALKSIKNTASGLDVGEPCRVCYQSNYYLSSSTSTKNNGWVSTLTRIAGKHIAH